MPLLYQHFHHKSSSKKAENVNLCTKLDLDLASLSSKALSSDIGEGRTTLQAVKHNKHLRTTTDNPETIDNVDNINVPT